MRDNELKEHAQKMVIALVQKERAAKAIEFKENELVKSMPNAPKQKYGFCAAIDYHTKIRKLKESLKYHNRELFDLYEMYEKSKSTYRKHKNQIISICLKVDNNTFDEQKIEQQIFPL